MRRKMARHNFHLISIIVFRTHMIKQRSRAERVRPRVWDGYKVFRLCLRIKTCLDEHTNGSERTSLAEENKDFYHKAEEMEERRVCAYVSLCSFN